MGDARRATGGNKTSDVAAGMPHAPVERPALRLADEPRAQGGMTYDLHRCVESSQGARDKRQSFVKHIPDLV
jgi:hypothetical protein